ncbi:MAG: hypothetical protein IJS29_00565 [Selenomonadaceae bacterium]|nr:hypothetical protein [Selenomonadaceae bacterium]
MKKFFMLAAFLCAFMLVSTVHAENWCHATVNHTGAWYIDSHSVMLEKNSDGELIFFAFVKQELSDYSREQYRRPNVEYRIFREEFKLSEGLKYFRVGATTNYNFDGSSYSDPVDTFDWDIIPASSVAEYLYQTAYRFLPRHDEE